MFIFLFFVFAREATAGASFVLWRCYLIWSQRVCSSGRSYGLSALLLPVGLVTWSELDVNIRASEEAWKGVWSCYHTARWVRGSERGCGDRQAVGQWVCFTRSSLSANLNRCTNTPRTESASLSLSEIKQSRIPAGSASPSEVWKPHLHLFFLYFVFVVVNFAWLLLLQHKKQKKRVQNVASGESDQWLQNKDVMLCFLGNTSERRIWADPLKAPRTHQGGTPLSWRRQRDA